MSSLTRYKLFLFSLFALAYCVLYIYPNFSPPSPPMMLPLFPIDNAIPFLPVTFYVYLSDYLLIFCGICWINKPAEFYAFARRAFGTLLVCGIFFLMAPTTYPRPPYPQNEPWLIDMVLKLMDVADRPTNCFPSMHVAMTATCTFSARYLGGWRYALLLIWSVAIFISTLTTKQHYALDIVGGLMVTFSVVLVDWAVFEKRLGSPWLNRKMDRRVRS